MSTNAMRIKNVFSLAALAGLVLVSVSCGDVIRSSDAPVMLVVSGLTAGTEGSTILDSDVLTRVATPPPCTATSPCYFVRNDLATASFSVVAKNVTVAPSTNNAVTISRYHVSYRRADGHNTPGVDVPHPFDGTVTLTIPAGSTGSVGFELVRLVAKQETPLVQLVSDPNVISTLADVTFYGTDIVGNDVSGSASMSVNFANYGP